MKLYINLIASFLIASISYARDIELQNPSQIKRLQISLALIVMEK